MGTTKVTLNADRIKSLATLIVEALQNNGDKEATILEMTTAMTLAGLAVASSVNIDKFSYLDIVTQTVNQYTPSNNSFN
jgi:hypothetical protein